MKHLPGTLLIGGALVVGAWGDEAEREDGAYAAFLWRDEVSRERERTDLVDVDFEAVSLEEFKETSLLKADLPALDHESEEVFQNSPLSQLDLDGDVDELEDIHPEAFDQIVMVRGKGEFAKLIPLERFKVDNFEIERDDEGFPQFMKLKCPMDSVGAASWILLQIGDERLTGEVMHVGAFGEAPRLVITIDVRRYSEQEVQRFLNKIHERFRLPALT